VESPRVAIALAHAFLDPLAVDAEAAVDSAKAVIEPCRERRSVVARLEADSTGPAGHAELARFVVEAAA